MWHIKSDDKQNRMQVKFSSLDQTGDLWVRYKGQISLNFVYTCQILRFEKQTLCMFYQIKVRKHIEHSFHSVAGVMPQGWDLGVLGGSKALAWGFAMALHPLCILVQILIINKGGRKSCGVLYTLHRKMTYFKEEFSQNKGKL